MVFLRCLFFLGVVVLLDSVQDTLEFCFATRSEPLILCVVTDITASHPRLIYHIL